jgi:hypothetical protein
MSVATMAAAVSAARAARDSIAQQTGVAFRSVLETVWDASVATTGVGLRAGCVLRGRRVRPRGSAWHRRIRARARRRVMRARRWGRAGSVAPRDAACLERVRDPELERALPGRGPAINARPHARQTAQDEPAEATAAAARAERAPKHKHAPRRACAWPQQSTHAKRRSRAGAAHHAQAAASVAAAIDARRERPPGLHRVPARRGRGTAQTA